MLMSRLNNQVLLIGKLHYYKKIKGLFNSLLNFLIRIIKF